MPAVDLGNVGFFGANRIVLGPYSFTNLIQRLFGEFLHFLALRLVLAFLGLLVYTGMEVLGEGVFFGEKNCLGIAKPCESSSYITGF